MPTATGLTDRAGAETFDDQRVRGGGVSAESTVWRYMVRIWRLVIGIGVVGGAIAAALVVSDRLNQDQYGLPKSPVSKSFVTRADVVTHVYPGATVMSTEAYDEGECATCKPPGHSAAGVYVRLATGAAPAKVLDWYRHQLLAAGWRQTGSQDYVGGPGKKLAAGTLHQPRYARGAREQFSLWVCDGCQDPAGAALKEGGYSFSYVIAPYACKGELQCGLMPMSPGGT
jgi:hypothetical protein